MCFPDNLILQDIKNIRTFYHKMLGFEKNSKNTKILQQNFLLARDYEQEKNINKTVKLRKLILIFISDFN